MFPVINYDYDLTDQLQKFAYNAMCAKFAAEYRILQFSNRAPKLPIYKELQNCGNFRLYVETFEPILDWCEYPSTVNRRTGYWLQLPAGVFPVTPAMGSPDRIVLPEGTVHSTKPPGALRQAVLWQNATGCTAYAACQKYGCSPSNFKIVRDRMIKRGEILDGPMSVPPKPLSPIKQAVLWQHEHGGSQGAACRRFCACSTGFKATRDRMIARGELPS